jgi:hypothetical protein
VKSRPSSLQTCSASEAIMKRAISSKNLGIAGAGLCCNWSSVRIQSHQSSAQCDSEGGHQIRTI